MEISLGVLLFFPRFDETWDVEEGICSNVEAPKKQTAVESNCHNVFVKL